jgi:hypothetical protein
MAMANTLANYDMATITAVKSFIVQALDSCLYCWKEKLHNISKIGKQSNNYFEFFIATICQIKKGKKWVLGCFIDSMFGQLP